MLNRFRFDKDGKLATADFGATDVHAVGKLPLSFAYNSQIAMQRGSLRTNRLAAWASQLALSHKLPAKIFGQTRYPFYSFGAAALCAMPA